MGFYLLGGYIYNYMCFFSC